MWYIIKENIVGFYREMEDLYMQTKRERNLISWGIIIGSLLGGLAAYFYAPQRGAETKKQLATKFNHLTQKTILQTQSTLIDLEQKIESSIEKDN